VGVDEPPHAEDTDGGKLVAVESCVQSMVIGPGGATSVGPCISPKFVELTVTVLEFPHASVALYVTIVI
jgi:hypothetical protein